jgi:hypothetical protein
MARLFIMTISTITVISIHNSQLIATCERVVLVCASESYTVLLAVSARQHL